MSDEFLKAALGYAKAGWAVLPLKERSKAPLTKHGVRDATTDPAQIREWWGQHPAANIGIVPPPDRFVYDVDVAKGKRGADTLESLEAEHGAVPRDLVQVTGSGGLHIVMAMEEGRRPPPALNSAHINVKGHTGYIVAAPSVHPDTGKRYRWEGLDPSGFASAAKAAPMAPDWLWQAARSDSTQSGDSDDLDYLTGRLQWPAKRLRKVLNRLDLEEWCDDYHGWLKVGMALHHESQGEDWGLDLWHEFSEESGKYDPDELDKRWRGFGKAPGEPIRFVSMVYEAGMESMLKDSDAPPDERKTKSKVTLKRWTAEDVASFNPPVEFVEGLLREGEFSAVIGPSGTGKTFFAYTLGFHVASGREFFGRKVRKRPVIYVGLEGEDGVISRNRALEIEYREDSLVYILTGAFSMRTDKATLKFVVDVARETEAGLIIIDTLARAMAGGDENSAQDMGLIIEAAGAIQRATGAHVMLIHHTGKDVTKGGRGSSALKPALDLEVQVETEGSIRAATVTKSKNSVDGDRIEFVIRSREIDFIDSWGEPMNVGVIRSPLADDFAPMEDGMNEREQHMFRTLKRLALLDDVTRDMLKTDLKREGWGSELDSESWRRTFNRTLKGLMPEHITEADGYVRLAN